MLKLILSWVYLLVFLVACQPFQYTPLNLSQAQGLLENTQDTPGVAHHRIPSEKEYNEVYTTNKLDLVFVLDTTSKMEAFYKTNLFGSDFLNRFEEYDWKFALTNMSVDTALFIQSEDQAEKEETKEKKSCNFWEHTTLTTAGIWVAQPALSIFGIKGLFGCWRSYSKEQKEKKEEQNKIYTNGSFVPFEYRGQKIQSEGWAQLNASVKNYNTKFDHSLKLGNEKDQNATYEAPEQRTTPSFPFLSMTLSMAKGAQPPFSSQGEQEGVPFFRKDSLIVYVLVTVHDMQVQITPETFKQSLIDFFGTEKRVKVIPVTFSSNPSFLCGRVNVLEGEKSESESLRTLAQGLGNKPLDICSQKLGEDLFEEISKSLYRDSLLKE